MKLRPYQKVAVEKALTYLRDPKNKRPQIIVAPTASGKSILIGAITKELGEPVLVLQPSKELLEQNIDKFRKFGGVATEYSASVGIKKLSRVTYATLGSVKDLAQEIRNLGVKTLLVDEAHDGYPPDESSAFMTFIRKLDPHKVIGLTATPYRLKSNDLGSELKLLNRMRPSYFKNFLHVIQNSEIINQGFWSKIVYELHSFDESGLRVNSSGAEFDEDAVKEALKVQGVNNNIYKRICKLLKEGCPSILVFVDSVDTAHKMSDAINAKFPVTGKTPVADVVTGNTSKKERGKIVENFKTGNTKVVVNFGTLTTGFDYPDLRTVIMGRPTLSLAKYYQIVGRGTRPSKETGKESFLYIDYCNNVDRFGMVENLVFEDIPGFGLAITNKDVILTNTLLSGPRKTKNMFSGGLVTGNDSVKIHFGKYLNTPVCDLPVWYMEFLLFKSEITFSTPKMQILKKSMELVLEKDKQLKMF
jgi:DNA repair protein RadD